MVIVMKTMILKIDNSTADKSEKSIPLYIGRLRPS